MSNRTLELMLPKWEREKTMPKEETKKPDLEFIFLSLNLIPIFGGKAAIAPGAIVDIDRVTNSTDDSYTGWAISLHGGKKYLLDDNNMADFERAIKQRQDDAKILNRENHRANVIMQIEVAAELQHGVQPVQGKIIDPTRRRH